MQMVSSSIHLTTAQSIQQDSCKVRYIFVFCTEAGI